MKHLAISIVLSLLIILAACGTLINDSGLLFKTADPNLSVGFRLLPAPPGVTVEPTAAPDPTAIAIEVVEEPQPNCNIAGNIAADGTPIYHVPSGAYYSRVHIDLERHNADGVYEQWFCSEAAAEAAGFRKSSR